MSKIDDFLQEKFQQNEIARTHFGYLLNSYSESELAPHVLREIKTGEESKFQSVLWEAMLYRHFYDNGFQFRRGMIRNKGQSGPDFGLIHRDKTIWVEAVVPNWEEGFPSIEVKNWLEPINPGEPKIRNLPGDEILLKITSSLKSKTEQREKWIKANVIEEADPYVIAINWCMLSRFPAEDFGVSQFPFIVEAVLPIGPISYKFSIDLNTAEEINHTVRRFIIKRRSISVSPESEEKKSTDIPVDNFLSPEYSGVSAAIGSSRCDMLSGRLNFSLIHNPCANSPIPTKEMCASQEYSVKIDEGIIIMETIRDSSD